jgi:hypothetical protein
LRTWQPTWLDSAAARQQQPTHQRLSTSAQRSFSRTRPTPPPPPPPWTASTPSPTTAAAPPARATHLRASSQTARPMAVRTTAVAQHSATRLSAAHRLAARPLAHRPPPAGPPRTRESHLSHRWNCPRFVAPATWRALARARADSGSCLRVAAALRSRCHLLPRLTTPTTLLPPGA